MYGQQRDSCFTSYSDSSELWNAEVGKMTIDYLLPPSKPSTRQVANIVYLKKKCRIARLRLTSLDLWKSRGIGGNVFLH
jgi:hypothetical protein